MRQGTKREEVMIWKKILEEINSKLEILISKKMILNY